MCYGPIEAVKYILVNIGFILDWILSQNCINTLSLHTVDQLANSAKHRCCCSRPVACSQSRRRCLSGGHNNYMEF